MNWLEQSCQPVQVLGGEVLDFDSALLGIALDPNARLEVLFEGGGQRSQVGIGDRGGLGSRLTPAGRTAAVARRR